MTKATVPESPRTAQPCYIAYTAGRTILGAYATHAIAERELGCPLFPMGPMAYSGHVESGPGRTVLIRLEQSVMVSA